MEHMTIRLKSCKCFPLRLVGSFLSTHPGPQPGLILLHGKPQEAVALSRRARLLWRVSVWLRREGVGGFAENVDGTC